MQRYDFLLKFSNLTEQNETVLIALIKKKGVFIWYCIYFFCNFAMRFKQNPLKTTKHEKVHC